MIARKGSNCLPEIRHAISLLKPQASSDTTLGLTIRGIICLLTIFPFRVHVNINGIRTYSRTRIWIRRLMSLAFVPPEDVITAFHTVLNAIPEDLDIGAFLNYFQATWIKGMSTVRRNGRAMYPPAVWNIRSRTLQMMNRTNNHLEAFHNAFKQRSGTVTQLFGGSSPACDCSKLLQTTSWLQSRSATSHPGEMQETQKE